MSFNGEVLDALCDALNESKCAHERWGGEDIGRVSREFVEAFDEGGRKVARVECRRAPSGCSVSLESARPDMTKFFRERCEKLAECIDDDEMWAVRDFSRDDAEGLDKGWRYRNGAKMTLCVDTEEEDATFTAFFSALVPATFESELLGGE